MAHHKDAIKRIRQDEKKKLRNKNYRTFYRNRIKEVRTAIEGRDSAAAATSLAAALKAIDSAAGKGLLHRNTAARYKSRLTKAVSGLSAAS